MEQKRERYRKLPGRRRGFLFGSSLWLGSDHLLLVNSARVRESYRRFYFRDIQAIVVAGAPRFQISTRSGLIGALWLVGLAILRGLEQGLRASGHSVPLVWIWCGVAAALLAAWAYISAFHSCRTRIHTAVSSEELPSVYRRWTAKRFLRKVEPLLIEAQGAFEGSLAEAVEEKRVGALPEGRLGFAAGPVEALAAAPPPSARTAVSAFFVASLCLGGLADLLTMGARADVGRWVLLGFLLLQFAAAVAVLAQNFRGALTASFRNLAIVTVASMGVWYYAVQMGAGIVIAYRGANSRKTQVSAEEMRPMALVDYPIARGIAGGIALALGMAGAVLLLRGPRPGQGKAPVDV